VSYLRYVARRFAFAVASVYAVATLAFVLGTVMLEWVLGKRLARARYGGATPEELQEIREAFGAARGLDAPLHERYLDWLVDVTTLEWGYSFAYRTDVITVLDGRVGNTLEYVLPGVALAVLLGVPLGVAAALAKDTAFDWSVRLGAYALFGVPAFVLLIVAALVAPAEALQPGGLLAPKPLAAVAVAAGLLAGQMRFARVAALERTGEAFVKTVKAKGAGRLRMGRHVLRNAALPVVSLSVTELLGVLVLQIYVIEEVLPIRGLAEASLRAIAAADVALVVWTTMVIVAIGIAGNFLKDVLYGLLDPRVGTGD